MLGKVLRFAKRMIQQNLIDTCFFAVLGFAHVWGSLYALRTNSAWGESYDPEKYHTCLCVAVCTVADELSSRKRSVHYRH
jgi:hypothetical protein